MDAEPPLERWAQALDASGDYRVLRRLPDAKALIRPLTGSERLVVLVDTETTGLDQRSDDIIELGMIALTYDSSGRLGDTIAVFQGLREPKVPIPAEVTQLTGITRQMVKGRHLDPELLARFVSPAALIVAHNAAFDRPFCERLSSIFAAKPWACSATEIPWQRLGFEGTKLPYLLNQVGLFRTGHRALDDCLSLSAILSHHLPDTEVTAFQILLRSARRVGFRIWARAPYEIRDLLRSRGYRWNPGGNGRPRAWWTEVPENSLESELAMLESKTKQPRLAYGIERITAFNRFRLFSALPKLRTRPQDHAEGIP